MESQDPRMRQVAPTKQRRPLPVDLSTGVTILFVQKRSQTLQKDMYNCTSMNKLTWQN